MQETRHDYKGELLKYTNIFKGWQNRWFVLDAETGVLAYYVNDPQKCKAPKGKIHLKNAIISTNDEDPLSFCVVSKQRSSARLRAKSLQERNSWMEKLAMVAERHSMSREPMVVKDDGFTSALREAEMSVARANESQFYVSRALDALPFSPFKDYYLLEVELKGLKESTEEMQDALNRCIASVYTTPLEPTSKSVENVDVPIPRSLSEKEPAPSQSNPVFDQSQPEVIQNVQNIEN